MRIVFHAAQKRRELMLGEALEAGFRRHGADFRYAFGQVPADCDVVLMFGVKSRKVFRAARAAGKAAIVLDKGYTREQAGGMWSYVRFAVNSHSPSGYLSAIGAPADRFERLGLSISPWAAPGRRVLIVGSSEKYHRFYDLEHPTEFARRIVADVRRRGDFTVRYRPKPSWGNAEPVEGAEFSFRGRSIGQDIDEADVVITHGSNACFEAMLAGKPCVVLGPGVARPISSTSLDDLPDPKRGRGRETVLSNLAYCQWTLDEYAAGDGVAHMLRHMELAA